MMHMIQHTFTHPLTHSEVVALATSHWPMPCVIKIIVPHNPEWFYKYREPILPKYVRRNFIKQGHTKRNRR